jgi:hypothetical protein
MWLVYLRFEGNGKTKVGHVRCINKEEAEATVKRGRKPGASFEGSHLVEYAFFVTVQWNSQSSAAAPRTDC